MILYRSDDLSDVRAYLVSMDSRDASHDPSSDLMVVVAGRFETDMTLSGARIQGGRGFGSRGEEYVARIVSGTLVTLRQERPSAPSVCDIMANPARYHNRVIAIDGEYRWNRGAPILFASKCGPDLKSRAILLADENDVMAEATEANKGDGPRVSVDIIAKGRFEVWSLDPANRYTKGGGFGLCACYSARLIYPTMTYPRRTGTVY